MLGLSDLSKSLNGEPLLAGLTLEIPAGQPTAIVGLSRAGREAMVRLLSGADRPDRGIIRLGGADIAKARKEKGRVARVGPSVLAASGQRVGKLIAADAAARAGLSGKVNAKVSELTAGQRARLGIAQAVAGRPGLLILDAPASQLPADARDDFAEHIGDMLEGFGGVVLLLASAADEALGLHGHIVVLDAGAVVQSGPAADVSAHPFNLASAIATSWPQLNTLAMTMRAGRCTLVDGSSLQLPESLPMPAEGACTLAFHPEDVTLERASPGCVRFVVRADEEQVRGEHRFLRVRFAETQWMCPLATTAPHKAQLLNAFVDQSRLLFFDTAGRSIR